MGGAPAQNVAPEDEVDQILIFSKGKSKTDQSLVILKALGPSC